MAIGGYIGLNINLSASNTFVHIKVHYDTI